MGFTSKIRIQFTKEKHARWAMHVAEEMLKIVLVPKDVSWAPGISSFSSLSNACLSMRKEAASLDLNPEHTALDWLKRVRTFFVLERCQDISRYVSLEHPWEFLPQFCCAYIMRFLQVPIPAQYRHEMTVSGALQLFRIR